MNEWFIKLLHKNKWKKYENLFQKILLLLKKSVNLEINVHDLDPMDPPHFIPVGIQNLDPDPIQNQMDPKHC